MQSKRYSTLFVCLIVAMLVSTALSSLAIQRCVPGKSYNDGCNDCSCTKTGVEICTMKLCENYDPMTGERTIVPKREAPADFWEPLDVIQPPKA